MPTPPVYPGTAREVVPGDRATVTIPDGPPPFHLDVAQVVFTDDEAHVSNASHPENTVPVAWLAYVGPTPDRWIIETAPGTLGPDLDAIDATGDAAALGRVMLACSEAVSIPTD